MTEWMLMTLAQVDGAAPAAAAAPTSVWDFAVKGGIMMIPLAICSLIVLAVTVERLITLRRTSVVPADFYPSLKRILESKPVDRDDAVRHAESSASPVGRVLAQAVRRLGRPAGEVRQKLVEAGEHEIARLRKRTRWLSVIASVAPLMGLTGTIFGMIKAFQTVAVSGEALGRTEMLATGIYEAMITTAAGLLVAIPALVFYNWVMARIERAAQDLSEIGADFIESFAMPAAVEVAAQPAESGAGAARA
ncbi:MAG: MotA/TolQ/ExbB proton channel family protein [Phycisphaerales bacterium JB039]